LKKLLAKIQHNPKTVRFEGLANVLKPVGFERSPTGGGSSHYIFRKGTLKLVVPFHQPYILQVYVAQALKLLEGNGEGGCSIRELGDYPLIPPPPPLLA
jgi:predicted RNA binding protein YcfA (HicA-like mRNA interferase family)